MASNLNKALNILKNFTKNKSISLFNMALDNVDANEPIEKSDCPYCQARK